MQGTRGEGRIPLVVGCSPIFRARGVAGAAPVADAMSGVLHLLHLRQAEEGKGSVAPVADGIMRVLSRYCWRTLADQATALPSATSGGVRVRARGVSASQAAVRIRLRAVAIKR